MPQQDVRETFSLYMHCGKKIDFFACLIYDFSFSLFIQTPYYSDHIAPCTAVPSLPSKIGFSRIDSPDSGINGTFQNLTCITKCIQYCILLYRFLMLFFIFLWYFSSLFLQ